MLQPRFQRRGRAVLDQVGEIVEEALGVQLAGVVGLARREDFLELVEDQQRDQRVAVGIAQEIPAVVQELPQ